MSDIINDDSNMAFFLVELKWHSSSQAALLDYSAFFNAGFKQLSALNADFFFLFLKQLPHPCETTDTSAATQSRSTK